jgi:hypothetical protein
MAQTPEALRGVVSGRTMADMAKLQQPRLLSLEGVLGLLLGIVAAVAEMNWAIRGFLVVAALVLIGHLAWRIHWQPAIRGILILVGAAILLVVTWRPIVNDFRKDHPISNAVLPWTPPATSTSGASETPQEIAKEFERVRTPLLGRTIQPIEINFITSYSRTVSFSECCRQARTSDPVRYSSSLTAVNGPRAFLLLLKRPHVTKKVRP